MSRKRIIARLDVKPPYVVKPVHFEGLRKVGDPVDIANKYYLQGADEIVYIDIVASLYRRPLLFDYIKKTAKDLFVPFAVGGGITKIEDIAYLIHNGVDKVIINTYALQTDPEIINRAARIFGSQAIVVHIQAKKWDGWWECYSDCGRIKSGKNVIDWAKEVEDRGAGELLISSVDKDGRQNGFDVDLISSISSVVHIPVIAGSGAGKKEDIKDCFKQGKADAVALASILHYQKETISSIKEYLLKNKIEVTL